MRRLGLILVILLTMAGCGGSATGIGQSAASQLGPQVEQIRATAMSGDRAAAAAKLGQLRASVADLRQRNQLSEAAAARVLAAAAEVESLIGVVVPPPAAQTATTAPAAPPATTPPPSVNGDKGKGKGKGKD